MRHGCQDFGSTVGTYTYQAYLHEIGHALGLGHAGNYNEDRELSVRRALCERRLGDVGHVLFQPDGEQLLQQPRLRSSYLVTPMVADMLAMQQLYGLSTTTRSGDTRPTGSIRTPAISTTPAVFASDRSLHDLRHGRHGHARLLRLRGCAADRPQSEQFSNIGGQNGNVTIARGTIIENAIGGSSADVIIGNSAANVLTGRAGVDRLTGGSGNDTFQDTRSGLNGDTITDFTAGDRIVFTDATLAGFSFSLSGSTLTYTGGSLTLSAPVTGTIRREAAAGGGVQLSVAVPTARERGDFNGDGRSDVICGMTMAAFTNGWVRRTAAFRQWRRIASNSRSELARCRHGDFNGDSRDDALLRHERRHSSWNGSARQTAALPATERQRAWRTPAAGRWRGTGDFNGDGRERRRCGVTAMVR